MFRSAASEYTTLQHPVYAVTRQAGVYPFELHGGTSIFSAAGDDANPFERRPIYRFA